MVRWDSIIFVKSFLHGEEFFGGMDPVLNYNHNIWKSASSIPCALQLLQIRHSLTSHILPNQNITILTSLYIWYLTRSGAVQLLQIYHSLKYGLEDIPAFTISNISRLRLKIHNLLDVQFIMLTSYTIWTIHLHIRIWLEDIPEPLWSQSNISRLRFTICNSWCLQCTLNIQFTMLKIYNSWCSQFTLNVQFTN